MCRSVQVHTAVDDAVRGHAIAVSLATATDRCDTVAISTWAERGQQAVPVRRHLQDARYHASWDVPARRRLRKERTAELRWQWRPPAVAHAADSRAARAKRIGRHPCLRAAGVLQ